MNKSSIRPFSALSTSNLQRGQLFGYILLGALLSFEIFNFGTTDFALQDLLGDLRFLGLRWATILSLAFCGIDFAGIARLFTPEQGSDEPAEVWYLFGAWLLAAAMNAMLTWWGVSVAMLEHPAAGSAILTQATLMKAVPIFVAFMVWLTRVLIIGAFSIAGERIFSMADKPKQAVKKVSYSKPKTKSTYNKPRPATQAFRPAPKQQSAFSPPQRSEPRAEPTYHPVGMAARSNDDNQPPWR
ncbi:MAG: hypothetical protein HN855_05110 [Anaerolineae bacterium]|nr:hypothetical protein [Anaerolineae bacterium]MBT7072703.1 hypothetical protein [Anaerolineae bacterium]MBT7324518.1 hypothetical protein [Anaerolineae bacterium]